MDHLDTTGIENIICNLCGNKTTTTIYQIDVRPDQKGVYHQDSWPIVQCQQCSLIYVNPRPDPTAFKAYYEFENQIDAKYVQDWFIENADLQRPTWQRFLRTLSRFAKPGKLVDVGCGAGTFLVEARRLGHNVTGQEVSNYFAEYGRSQFRLPIEIGELEDVDLSSNSFDYATAFDVIEHHPYPKQMLQEIYRLLRPNGLLMISTHDIGNFFARFYGQQWRHINPIGHLTYFNQKTLTAMLQESGFKLLHKGGIHTIDNSRLAEYRNWFVQFIRVILIRALFLFIYTPITHRLPVLTKWEFTWHNKRFNHKKLMLRVGNQLIMNDDIVIIAQAIKNTLA